MSKEYNSRDWWLLQQGRALHRLGIDNTEETLAIINNLNWMIENQWIDETGATSILNEIINTFTGENYEH